MVTAYIMVKASTGDVDRLKQAITDVDEGIESVNIVAGDVDFILKARVDGPGDVKTIAAAVQDIDGIEDTQTYIAMD